MYTGVLTGLEDFVWMTCIFSSGGSMEDAMILNAACNYETLDAVLTMRGNIILAKVGVSDLSPAFWWIIISISTLNLYDGLCSEDYNMT